MIRAFVTGWPIKHSKSPILHGYWLKEHKINGSYDAIAVEPDNFLKFLKELPDSNFSGGNITIPHKELAFENIALRDEAAEMIGATNTIWLGDGAIHASNTDGYGFVANLDDFSDKWRSGKTATIMGAGGASRAVVYAILEAGFTNVRIANRTLSRAQNLADRFGERCSAHAWAEIADLTHDTDLLVNTSSVGMAGNEEVPIPDLSNLPAHALVTDIVYTPLETPILKQAKILNLHTIDGLGMLLHQAVPGFEKWFGIRPKVTDQLRQTILEAS
ncbi:MAG: shikimate dehydrogenase [Rhizobiaceae bacterium]|nr:shikimate dehydrogenase [Rhizobiaceae bacterium]